MRVATAEPQRSMFVTGAPIHAGQLAGASSQTSTFGKFGDFGEIAGNSLLCLPRLIIE
jgi:hypothetical protein